MFLFRHLLSDLDTTGGAQLTKRYNKSQAKPVGSTQFNPDFWEVRVDQQSLDRFPTERNPHYETEEDVLARFRRSNWIAQWKPIVLDMIDKALTPRQREIVHLYFFEQMTEGEIAKRLGISVPSVSQHLFGKSRGGKIVGGAIPKLRKTLIKHAGESGLNISSYQDDTGAK